MNMTGRRPAVTLFQYARIVDVRKARRRIPSNAALARELGLPIALVKELMRRRIKRYESIVEET